MSVQITHSEPMGSLDRVRLDWQDERGETEVRCAESATEVTVGRVVLVVTRDHASLSIGDTFIATSPIDKPAALHESVLDLLRFIRTPYTANEAEEHLSEIERRCNALGP